jgi:hypothetical protein
MSAACLSRLVKLLNQQKNETYIQYIQLKNARPHCFKSILTPAMVSPPDSTTANLLYIVEPPEGGVGAYQYVNADPTTGERQRNFEREEKSVIIENIRGKEDSVSLDTTGFQFYRYPSKHTSFANDEEIRQGYYPESAELIKKVTGASRVELFDHSQLLRPIRFF